MPVMSVTVVMNVTVAMVVTDIMGVTNVLTNNCGHRDNHDN